MERIAMNPEERDWLEWLKRAQEGVVTQTQAAEKMGVSESLGTETAKAISRPMATEL